MQAEELTMLVEQARRGNSQAFIDLMSSAQRDLRVFIGTFAAHAEMAERIFADTLAEARRQLIDCPATPAIFTWLRQLAMSQLGRRIDEELRQAQIRHEVLAEVLAVSSEHALQQQTSPSNSAGQSVGVRYGKLTEPVQRLISTRYGDGLTGEALAAAMGMSQIDLAEALVDARAQVDWSPPSGAAATTPSFPGLVDAYLSGRLDAVERTALAEEIAGNQMLAAQFVRQVRVDLLLAALFGAITRDGVQKVVAKLGGGHESSRLMMGPAPMPPPPAEGGGKSPAGMRRGNLRSEVRRNSGARARPGTSSIHQNARPAGSPPGRPSSHLRAASGATLPMQRSVDEDDVPPPSRTPLYLAIGAVAIGLVATIAIWAGSSARGTTVVPGAPSPTVQSAPGMGRIERAIGDANLLHDGKKQGANIGEAVEPGDGMQTSGTAVLSMLVDQPQLHVTISGDTQADHITPGSRLRIQLDHGRLDLAAVERSAGAAIEVITPLARIAGEPGKMRVSVVAGRTLVEVTEGAAELARADGNAGVHLRAGQSASLVAHTDPVLEEGTVFLRGIAFGGGSVSIGGNAFLSRTDALQAGLTIAPGPAPAADGAISAPGLDFDLKAMLDGGLSSVDSMVRFSQVVPNGTYDVQVWIANEQGIGDSLPRVSLQGVAATSAVHEEHASTWCSLGPYRGTVTTHNLDVQVDGLGRSRLCGMALYAVGHANGGLPPLISLASPLPDSDLEGEVALLARVVGTTDVAEVAFLAGDRVVATSTSEPYHGIWADPPPGKVDLRVKVTDHAGGTVLSQPVSVTIRDPLELGLIRRETWNGIAGGRVSDFVNRPEYPDHPTSVTYDSSFSFPENHISDFATRMRGYLHPPSDGDYVFWISGDDNCELWLSTDQSPEHRRMIAQVPGYTGFQEWEHDPAQRSAPIHLSADKAYYVEALHKQGGGGAHLSVGWKLPDGTLERPIPGSRLSVAVAGSAQADQAARPVAGASATAPAAPAAPATRAATPAVPAPVEVPPRFITAIKFGGGDGVPIDGNKWLSQRQAESSGLVVRNGRPTAMAMEPKPAVDASMRAMLTGGVTASGGPLELILHVPNGIYQVYAWYMETTLANARSFDLEVNGEPLNGLGGLAVGSWSRYGPVHVGVRTGMLDVLTKAKKGAALLMGIAVYATFDPAVLARAYPTGTARVLPCSISCADYDQGGEGVAYHDTDDRNEGGKYRHDGVDIDDKPGGGFCVGWVHTGEWLSYTVLSPKTTTYTLAIRSGSPFDGTSCHVEIDGVNVSGRMQMLKTGDWKKWAEVVKNGIPISEGAHVVRLVIDGPASNGRDFCNFDAISFAAE